MKTACDLKNAALLRALDEIKTSVKFIAGDGARLILYGSYARGEERPDSDVDLMVVLPDEMAALKTKDAIRNFIYDYDDFLFSVLIVTESQVKQNEGFMVFGSVENEGVLI